MNVGYIEILTRMASMYKMPNVHSHGIYANIVPLKLTSQWIGIPIKYSWNFIRDLVIETLRYWRISQCFRRSQTNLATNQITK